MTNFEKIITFKLSFMRRSFTISILTVFFTLFGIEFIHATKFLKLSVVDKDYLMVHFRDGEVRYRDDGTGPSAFLGHTFVEGDDTLKVFGDRLDPSIASMADNWSISSNDDASFGTQKVLAAYRKSKQ